MFAGVPALCSSVPSASPGLWNVSTSSSSTIVATSSSSDSGATPPSTSMLSSTSTWSALAGILLLSLTFGVTDHVLLAIPILPRLERDRSVNTLPTKLFRSVDSDHPAPHESVYTVVNGYPEAGLLDPSIIVGLQSHYQRSSTKVF